MADVALIDDRTGCALCGSNRPLTFHHLIPKKLHRRDFFRKNYSRTELSRGIDVCRLCHDGIHDRYDEITLGKKLNTLEALRSDDTLRPHIAWAARQKKT